MNIPVALTATGCVLLLAGGGVPAADNPGRGQGPRPRLTTSVLELRTMVGVNGPFLGDANPIRGVSGGGLPWVLDAVKGELSDDGKLEVQVEGLVIPAGDAPSVCEGVACNPAPFFRAIVSCLTVDDAGAVAVHNMITDNGTEVMIGDPKNGDARIEAVVDLPDPCVAPIVFVTHPDGAWFAASGAGVIASF